MRTFPKVRHVFVQVLASTRRCILPHALVVYTLTFVIYKFMRGFFVCANVVLLSFEKKCLFYASRKIILMGDVDNLVEETVF